MFHRENNVIICFGLRGAEKERMNNLTRVLIAQYLNCILSSFILIRGIKEFSLLIYLHVEESIF